MFEVICHFHSRGCTRVLKMLYFYLSPKNQVLGVFEIKVSMFAEFYLKMYSLELFVLNQSSGKPTTRFHQPTSLLLTPCVKKGCKEKMISKIKESNDVFTSRNTIIGYLDRKLLLWWTNDTFWTYRTKWVKRTLSPSIDLEGQ